MSGQAGTAFAATRENRESRTAITADFVQLPNAAISDQIQLTRTHHMTIAGKPVDDSPILSAAQREASREMAWVDRCSRLLDTKFRIPGTNVRFGADFLLGLVPGAGDVLSMAFSGLLIATMAKHGASGRLLARMVVNVVVDTVVGAVPILGNIFDLFYKANYRNAKLMREYYDFDRHQGSVWPVVATVVGLFMLMILITIWLFYLFFGWLFSLVSG